MGREICIRQVRKWTVSIHLQYPIMVIMSFCSSSVMFSFKVRYCGKREIFLRFCGITYPPKTPPIIALCLLHGGGRYILESLLKASERSTFPSAVEDGLFSVFGVTDKTKSLEQALLQPYLVLAKNELNF